MVETGLPLGVNITQHLAEVFLTKELFLFRPG